MARERARGGVGLGEHEVGGELAQGLQAGALPGGVLGTEQRAPARAEQLDQLAEETPRARARRARRRRCDAGRRSARSVHVPRAGNLRRLGGGAEAGDEVELSPPRELDHAREVRLAQFDRRTGKRAHHGGGVVRIDEQAHPGEHVAHLGAG